MSWEIKVLLATISGILYRLGGASKKDDCWNWLRHTLTRDIGVSLIPILYFFPSFCWIGLLFSFGLSWGILSTGYGGEGEPKEEQSFLYRIFGKYVFFAVGFGFGLALLPFTIHMAKIGQPIWIPFFIRTLILTLAIPFIHKIRQPVLWWNSAQVEEFMRGFVITITYLVF